MWRLGNRSQQPAKVAAYPAGGKSEGRRGRFQTARIGRLKDGNAESASAIASSEVPSMFHADVTKPKPESVPVRCTSAV